ncbi:MAG: hypothetical protein AABY22_17100 [Nanoarchaeota archaeon]
MSNEETLTSDIVSNTTSETPNQLKGKECEGIGKVKRYDLVKNLVGKKFGKLLVLEIVGVHNKSHNVIFRCKCDCGIIKNVRSCNLSRAVSCGCYRYNVIDKERKIKICSSCKISKNIEEFAKNKSRKDGKSQFCKNCKLNTDKKYRGKYQSTQTEYTRNRRRTDISFRIASNLRRRVNEMVRTYKKSNRIYKKVNRTLELLGCSIEEFRLYLQSLFQPGMTWENYGLHSWHIDHIIPCDKFNLTEEEDQRKCFHYSNMQPLWAIDNIRKGNKTEYVK